MSTKISGHPEPQRFTLHYNTDGDGFVTEAGVQDTWYTIVDHKGFVKLHKISVYQKNDEAAAKTVAVELTWTDSGGERTLTMSAGQNDNTRRSVFIYMDHGDDLSAFDLGYDDTAIRHFSDIANSSDWATGIGLLNLKVRYRSTSVAGTNQELNGAVVFEELVAGWV